MKLPVDEIISGSHALRTFHTRGTWKTNDSGFRHQHRDQPVRALDIHAHREFGMNTPISVSATGGDMDFPDQTGEPQSAGLGRAGRAFLIPVGALSRHSEKAATALYWCPSVDKSIDHRVQPFRSTRPSSSSHVEAFFRVESSCSSCKIRCLAA